MNRIVHIGLGNFHRAHQAWWTAAVVDPSDPWQISAYSVHRPDLVTALNRQGGRYTLIERGPAGDGFEVVDVITEAVDGRDTGRLRGHLADPATRIVTLTVTERGYHLRPDGRLDLASPEIRADLALAGTGEVRTPVGRLLFGLLGRYDAGAEPIAVVPCDNVPANGRRLKAALLELAGPGPGRWIEECVSFVDTSVDRITPRATVADRAEVFAATGFADQVPVVTEPFRDWVLSGDFPGGRPAWERAGARFVADIGPWERRKLYLLNGAHSLLAYAGQLRGHHTVAEAIADPYCADRVQQWWDDVSGLLPQSGLAEYRAQLLDRFANPAIRHDLRQIAEDAVPKLRARVAEPVAELTEVGSAAFILAAWLSAAGRTDVEVALAEVDPRLADRAELLHAVQRETSELKEPTW